MHLKAFYQSEKWHRRKDNALWANGLGNDLSKSVKTIENKY